MAVARENMLHLPHGHILAYPLSDHLRKMAHQHGCWARLEKEQSNARVVAAKSPDMAVSVSDMPLRMLQKGDSSSFVASCLVLDAADLA